MERLAQIHWQGRGCLYLYSIGVFKLAGRGEQRGALVASNRSTGRTSSNAQMGPRVWVLGDLPQGDIPVETDFPSGFFCDPYLPSDPGSQSVTGAYAPEDLGRDWGVPAGENGVHPDILPQGRPWVLPGSPQLHDVEWDNWSYDTGRSLGWSTRFPRPSATEELDPIGRVQYDGQIHKVYGDCSSPSDHFDERGTFVARGTLLEDQLYGPAGPWAAVEE